MTTTDYARALTGPFIHQYWWLVLILIAAAVLKLFSPVIKGRIGEGVVNLAAKLRLDSKIYHLIKDVTIPCKNGTTQIDHVIVSVYGLFVIETKNYKGWIFGDARSRNWTQVNFKKKNRFQNPIHQNHAHVCALADLLGIPKEKIHGVVCFMGDAKFKTKIPDGVFIQGSYVTHIKSFKNQVLSKAEVAEIINQIEASRLKRGFKTNRAHVQQLKDGHAVTPATSSNQSHIAPDNNYSALNHGSSQAQALSQAQVCPAPKTCAKCGAKMVLRTARRGANAGDQFWGCSSFPKCRSTLPVAD